MSDSKKKPNIWLIIGAVILILLLIFWLGWAMFLGDTDVAAFISPIF